MRFLLLFLALPLGAQTRTPILIDTDIGDAIDDSLALALAVNSPELDVRGVTTVIDDVESKTKLAWKELTLLGRRDIPLAMGVSEPLLDPVVQSKPKEFEALTKADAVPEAARRSAVGLIVETLMNAREPITIVAIGPLTNIALALKTEPRIKQKLARIVLMGGAFSNQSATPRAEYNVKRDPVAAEIVFHSGVAITAVGLEVTEPCKLREQDLAKLRNSDAPAVRFLLHLIDLSKAETGDAYPTLYDPLAVAVVFRKELIEASAGAVSVSLADASRGQTRFTAGAGGAVQVGTKVNVPAFLDLFTARLSRSGMAGPPR
ncbi:MAG TPA: nucleoside hydrolase [Bryobacteraceae bacterium]|jgi:inosine-uridine nucleoside N-ribohydrolase